MLVEPRRNHSSSRTTAGNSTFLVVTSGKPVAQVVAGLRAEQRDRAGAGAIGAALAVLEHVAEELEVRPHPLRIARARTTSRSVTVPRSDRRSPSSLDGLRRRPARRVRRARSTARGALPGAAALIAELAPARHAVRDRHQRRVALARDLRRGGSPALGPRRPAERIVTSGSLLPGYFRERGPGRRAHLRARHRRLDRVRRARAAACRSSSRAGMEIDAVASATTPARRSSTASSSRCRRSCARSTAGRRPALVLPNPDLVYPKGGGELGFTAGAMALADRGRARAALPGAEPRVRAPRQAGAAICSRAGARAGSASPRSPRDDRRSARDRHRRRARRRHRRRAARRQSRAGIRPSRIAPTYLLATDRQRRDPAVLLRQAPRRRGRDPRASSPRCCAPSSAPPAPTSIVGLPADDSAARWDLSIVITAASLDAWNALAQLSRR